MDLFNAIVRLFTQEKPMVSPLAQPTPSPTPDPFVEKGWVKGDDGTYRRPEDQPKPTNAPTPSPTPPQSRAKVRTGESDAFIEDVILPITRQYGIPDAIAAGQFAAEGRLGGLGASRNNYFNLGAYDHNLDNTFRYETPQDGVEAFARLLTEDKRYSPYFKEGRDALETLQDYASTYASNPKYVDLITGTPEWRNYYNK